MQFEPILHSVSYAGAWAGQAHLPLVQFVRKAAELGFKGVMLMAKRPHLSALDYDSDSCRGLREFMEQLGVRCRVIAGYTNFSADAEHAEVPQREFQIAHVTELARMARDLGAGVVRIFTAYDHASVPYPALHRVLIETLRECAKRASDYGVTLGVQNHHDMAVDYRSMKDLLEEVGEPNCRAAFDAWAPALQGTDLVECARAMAPLTCHTTAADYAKRPRFRYQPGLINYAPQTPWVQMVPMGEGFIDYRAFLGALWEGGYRGPAAFEMCAPLLGGGSIENLDGHARSFLRFLESLENQPACR
jgi:sugar phosphate isomerase/epimerase